MNSVLTPEESAALREDMQPPAAPAPADAGAAVEAAVGAVAVGEAPRKKEPIFAAASERGLQKKLPSLEQRFVRISESLRGVLGKALRSPVTVMAEPATPLTPLALAEKVPSWAVTADMSWSAVGQAGFVGLNYAFAYALIELAYGAPPSQLAVFNLTEGRQRLTEVERQTLLPLLQTLCRTVVDNMPAHVVGTPSAKLMNYPVQFDGQQNIEAGILKTFAVKVGQADAQVHILLYSHVLENLDEENNGDASEASQLISSHLVQTDVNVMALLGRTQVPLNHVMNLKKGDMLWLESAQSDYLPIYVEETIKFLAQPIARNGALGVEIVAKVP